MNWITLLPRLSRLRALRLSVSVQAGRKRTLRVVSKVKATSYLRDQTKVLIYPNFVLGIYEYTNSGVSYTKSM